jgi:Transposase IS4
MKATTSINDAELRSLAPSEILSIRPWHRSQLRPNAVVTEPPILIPTKLPQFEANYVANRAGASRYISLSEIELFTLFFDDVMIDIFIKETNLYAEIYKLNNSLPTYERRRWKPITVEKIRIFIKIHLYFSLYSLTVRKDY